MSGCAGCGAELAPNKAKGRKRKWCSQRCRRQTLYGGTCKLCGNPTNGHNGPGTAAEICGDCHTWRDDEIIAAIQRWADEHGGVPPTCTEWRAAGPEHPSSDCVIKRMGWNEAILQAGFALKMDRRPETQKWVEEQLRAGRPTTEIADALGVTPAAIEMRMRYRGKSIRELRRVA